MPAISKRRCIPEIAGGTRPTKSPISKGGSSGSISAKGRIRGNNVTPRPSARAIVTKASPNARTARRVGKRISASVSRSPYCALRPAAKDERKSTPEGMVKTGNLASSSVIYIYAGFRRLLSLRHRALGGRRHASKIR